MTPYEANLCRRYSITLEYLKSVRYKAKGLLIPLTMSTAIELDREGKLDTLKQERVKELTFIDKTAESVQSVKLSKRDSDDDVSKILKDLFVKKDIQGIADLLTKCKCKANQIDRLVTDYELGEVNHGIIRMRAGNMLRNALRRRIL